MEQEDIVKQRSQEIEEIVKRKRNSQFSVAIANQM
jgi:hypothetical protein